VSYRRALLVRWSRRDRLAVVVVATVVALLVGSTLVVVTAADETTQLASHLNTTGGVTAYDDPDTARANAPADALVLPTATATRNGTAVTVIGVPDSGVPDTLSVPPPPDSDSVNPPSGTNTPFGPNTPPSSGANATVTLDGTSGSLSLQSVPRERTGIVPSWWYVGHTETVQRLGVTGAVVVSPQASALADAPVPDSPLVGGLPFFVRGTEQLLAGLGAVTVGVAVLVVVVVFSVTRMTVEDRLATLAVLRATGLGRRRLVALFATRAGILATVAVVGGAAAGVVLTNAAVNAAVFAGLPTTLSLRVTGRVVGILAPALFAVLLVGILAGGAATIPAARLSPAALARRAEGAESGPGDDGPPGFGARLAGLGPVARLSPRVLPTDAVVPTAATLAVFVAVVLVTVTMATTVAPLSNPDETTVVQSGSSSPWSSRVDADYATALRASGVAASPEVFVFSVVDDDPFLTRGAAFDAFANVSDARLVAGREPDDPGEAVVGRDLARSTGIARGDRFALGGGNRPAFTTVTVVGMYRAPGLYDDQLLVPLRTARHLSNTGSESVNVIRVARPTSGPDSDGGVREATDSPDGSTDQQADLPDRIAVVDVAAPERVSPDEPISIDVTVRNGGTADASRTLTVALGNATRTQTVSLAAGERRTLSVTFDPFAPGQYRLSVGNRTRSVVVADGPTVRIDPLPDGGPPNSTLLVTVRKATGEPLPNATVSLGPRRGRTGASGEARVSLPDAGSYRLTASRAGFANASRQFTVSAGAPRRLTGGLTVVSTDPGPLDRPTINLTLANPWNRSLQRDVTVSGAGSRTRTVTLGPGERTSREVELDRPGPGTHTVTATVDGRRLASTTLTVRGDERMVAALATSGRTETVDSGLGRAASTAFGNLRVLLGTLVALAAVATVATTTAAFARAVHSRRRTVGIYRATGATPRQVFTTVLGDALRIAVPATVLALVLGYAGTWVLARAGVLTAFGVSLVPVISVPSLVATAVGTLSLALAGAAVAAAGLLRVEPATLFARPGEGSTSTHSDERSNDGGDPDA
jgi:ABC-type lipoprotein release transport system permease subunit